MASTKSRHKRYQAYKRDLSWLEKLGIGGPFGRIAYWEPCIIHDADHTNMADVPEKPTGS